MIPLTLLNCLKVVQLSAWRRKNVIRAFTGPCCGCRPNWNIDRYGMLSQNRSNSIHLWWSCIRWMCRACFKQNRSALISLAQTCFFNNWEETQHEHDCLLESISNWNYLLPGINRSFNYEPVWHKKTDTYDKNAVDEALCGKRKWEIAACHMAHS